MHLVGITYKIIAMQGPINVKKQIFLYAALADWSFVMEKQFVLCGIETYILNWVQESKV